MFLENAPPVHVHNLRKIKRKHCGVAVSEQRSTRLSLRSAGLWTILTPFPRDIRLIIYLFIYLLHLFIYLFISNKYYALHFIS